MATSDDWRWDDSVTVLGVQDHLEEFSARFGSAPTLDEILKKNDTQVKAARTADDERKAQKITPHPTFRSDQGFADLAGREVYLPVRTGAPKQFGVGQQTTFVGPQAQRKVSVKLKLSAPVMPPVANPSTEPGPARTDPPGDAGITFKVKSYPVPFASPPEWQRSLKEVDAEVASGTVLDLGEFPVGSRTRYIVLLKVKVEGFQIPSAQRLEKEKRAPPGWLVELSVRSKDGFISVQWRQVNDSKSTEMSEELFYPLQDSALDEVGPFARVFTLVYEYFWNRGLAACYAARREIHNGRLEYGQNGKWEGAVEGQRDGNNRGKFIDRYKKSVHGAVDGTEWCGTFVGYCYLMAGFDLKRPYSVVKFIADRRQVFSAVPKILKFVEDRCELLKFIHKSDEKNREWLGAAFKAWRPRAGDILMVSRLVGNERRTGHIALVDSYDEAASTLYVYEGNAFDRAKDSRYDLTKPEIFAKCVAIGRFPEWEFDKGPESDIAKVLMAGTDGYESEFSAPNAPTARGDDKHN